MTTEIRPALDVPRHVNPKSTEYRILTVSHRQESNILKGGIPLVQLQAAIVVPSLGALGAI